ncbi:MAG: pyruvate ferredoxin oxidoreductase [Deltaproteobacteria bacterium]|nr:pyruvate ferredoxin oxidoreductase [Deltaproteobacteria bacterium]
MAKRLGVEVSIAVAEAAKQCNVDVISAYPITPQTHIVEHLSELVADGELDAEFIPVESEHTAMSTCVGASAAGARTFTATSSQGLALMVEILYIASALRLPVVMSMVNRALSGPISIWNDHCDLMLSRDTGWIQTVAENGQEAYDLIFHAYRVAEDHRVLLPVIVNLDGFTLSHVIEPIEYFDQAEVDSYLKPYVPAMRLDPKHPITMGPVGMPEVYTEARKAQEEAIKAARPVIAEAWQAFGDQFGRYYRAVESYQMDGAETVLITMGSIGETAMTAVDEMRSRGKKVGLLRIRLFRPFPVEELRKALKGVKRVGVIDRALPFGASGGPVAAEVRSALYHQTDRPFVYNYIAGLGGRDVTVENFEEMASELESLEKSELTEFYKIINVRE